MGSVKINSAKLEAVLRAKSEQAAARAANNFREKVREEIIASGRVNTGEMFTQIEIAPGAPGPRSSTWTVRFLSKHFRFQDQGTRGVPAKPGRVLRFKPKGSGVFVFARSTGPITAGHFLRKARARMSARDFT